MGIIKEIREFYAPFFGSDDTKCLEMVFFDDNGEFKKRTFDSSQLQKLLLSDDKDIKSMAEEKIEQICIYRQGKDDFREFHAFAVIQTERYFYSIERWFTCIQLQRSKVIDHVISQTEEEKRKRYIRDTVWAKGQGNVIDVISLLLRKRILEKTFHYLFRNCQVLAALIYKNFSADRLIFKKYRKHPKSPLASRYSGRPFRSV